MGQRKRGVVAMRGMLMTTVKLVGELQQGPGFKLLSSKDSVELVLIVSLCNLTAV